jgi:hypothetical protein
MRPGPRKPCGVRVLTSPQGEHYALRCIIIPSGTDMAAGAQRVYAM